MIGDRKRRRRIRGNKFGHETYRQGVQFEEEEISQDYEYGQEGRQIRQEIYEQEDEKLQGEHNARYFDGMGDKTITSTRYLGEMNRYVGDSQFE